MSEEIKHEGPSGSDDQDNELTAKVTLDSVTSAKIKGKLLPGVAAIALYMMALAAVIAFGILGGHYPRLLLIMAALFVTASYGLLQMFRWAWALALSAVFLLFSYNFWIFASTRQAPGLIQGVLNLGFFLYLVRTDVRTRLR